MYGHNTPNTRIGLWDSPRSINLNSLEPWLILGDFNAILSHEDRITGDPVKPQETEEFQPCINDIGVGRLQREGRHFTWCNKRDVATRIYTRIDCWMLKHGTIEADFANPGCSNHTPIIVNTGTTQTRLKDPLDY